MTIATKNGSVILKSGSVAQSCGCCDNCPADGKPRTDPKDEGTWLPSSTPLGTLWTFQPNPGDASGETWFFYGSYSTSKKGGAASDEEIEDWGNICNWYSNKTTDPSAYYETIEVDLNKRATRLPPENATVHIYSRVSTERVGGATVARAYFWGQVLYPTIPSIRFGSLIGGVLTTTETAHGSTGGSLFDTGSVNDPGGTVNGGATFNRRSFNLGTVNGGATFNDRSENYTFFGAASGIVNGGATFSADSFNYSVVNGGATFNSNSQNVGTVNGGATFNDSAKNNGSGTVNGGATFNGNSANARGTVNDGATFNDSAINDSFGFVNGGATFNSNSQNVGTVLNGGATFNDSAINDYGGFVNGGATFNDAACSFRSSGFFQRVPCTRKFVAHPTDLPVCNGTAPSGCDSPPASCGCG